MYQKREWDIKRFRPEITIKKRKIGYRPLTFIHEVDVGFAFWKTRSRIKFEYVIRDLGRNVLTSF